MKRKASHNENGDELLDVISVGNRLRDPLCYPLIFFDGCGGWHSKLSFQSNTGKTVKVSPMLFYSRLFYTRKGDFNTILRCGRLFQQFLCEAAYTMESERLSFLRYNQSKIRATNHTRLLELLGDAAMSRNEVKAWTEGVSDEHTGNIGRLVVLPATYIGGDRYMRMKMHDIIAISNSLGHPDVFLTMTCNPNLPEITDALFTGQRPDDRPDLCNRVFKMKQRILLQYLKTEEHFGRMIAHVSVIQFQKRGLPHAHIILFLDEKAKNSLQNPDHVDMLISAEIPPISDPQLRSAVLKHMIHKPCTQLANAPCLRDGRCSRGFPKQFRFETSILEGANYISYKRRDELSGGATVKMPYLVRGMGYQDCCIDNSWVVPYSPFLLRMFNCHFNVELCISKVGSIKYLFKYVCKGQDRVTVEVRNPDTKKDGETRASSVVEKVVIDEIKDYQDARYISATEADWRLRGNSIVEHDPNVVRLEVHLEGQHVVYFQEGREKQAVRNSADKRTKLMAWFIANCDHPNARHIRYVYFPKYFTWNKTQLNWAPRVQFKDSTSSSQSYDFTRSPTKVVGRMYTVSPREGEKYFLRTLLLHRSGAVSFDELLEVNGVKYPTYRDACCALGLLANDKEWQNCIDEAFRSSFEPLTAVFATILAFSEPSNPLQLWRINEAKFISDLRKRYEGINESYELLKDDRQAALYALREIQDALTEINSKLQLSQFGIQSAEENLPELLDSVVRPSNTEEELRTIVVNSLSSFNKEQEYVFNRILHEVLPGVSSKDPFAPVTHGVSTPHGPRAFFLDAPGGTGKTFTIRAIQALLQMRDRTVIPVATSAVAASILSGGRTAHSVFKIPIPCFADSVCSISMDSELAKEIRSTKLIIWDEIVMCMRYCIEAVDRTLRAIMKAPHIPFGGKCVLFSGDFRQILPVVPKGSRGMIVHLCFKSSPLFSNIIKLNLVQNMRLESLKKDPFADSAALSYPGFLLSLGEGRVPEDENGNIELPDHVQTTDSSTHLIDTVFPDISDNYKDPDWMISRAILSATNSASNDLNDEIGSRIPGSYKILKSADSVTADDPEQQDQLDLRYPQELLNALDTGSSMPDHTVQLKKGFIVMLLRNIRPSKGHVNGTRYVVLNMTNNLLFLRAVSGSNQGESFVLPRMNCLPGMEDFPVPGFKRCQFPVRVCFAMTINKAQGQSISGKLGLDLSYACFSHGQLYVAMSRTTNPRNLIVLTPSSSRSTRNVVYREVISDSPATHSASCCNGRTRLCIETLNDDQSNLAEPPAATIHEKERRLTDISFSSGRTITESSISQDQSIVLLEDKSSVLKGIPETTTNTTIDNRDGSVVCSGITVLRSEISSVRDDALVIDNALNSFIGLLESPSVLCFHSYFHEQLVQHRPENALNSLYRANARARLISRMSTAEILLIPVHTPYPINVGHWGLIYLHKARAQITLFDSSLSTNFFSGHCRTIQLWAHSVAEQYDVQGWPNHWTINDRLQDSIRQPDARSCGVMVMLKAYYIAKNSYMPLVTYNDIVVFREKLSQCIENSSLLPLV